VLLNYQGKMDDAFTLGHELGHAMHSHYSAESQPFETAHYRILAAEVASTVNETLMTHHLLKGETDRVKRAYYITQFLESFRTTCFRQTMFAEFELKAHRMAESGEPLTVDSLSEMYRALNELYYDGAHVDETSRWNGCAFRISITRFTSISTQPAFAPRSSSRTTSSMAGGGTLYQLPQKRGSDYPIEELKAAGGI
jgi:oligoendopeptidase F